MDLEGIGKNQEQERIQQIKQQILRQILAKDARERLNRVRLAHPQLAEHVELAIMQAAQAGQIQQEIDDQKLKNILTRIQEEKQSFRLVKWDQ